MTHMASPSVRDLALNALPASAARFDRYDMRRFIEAQEPVYEYVTRCLRLGIMQLDWMDFIFPTLALPDWPHDPRFSIASRDEACAFLSSPVLGGRYRECVLRLQRLSHLSASDVFGGNGAGQLHASLTLFSSASDEFLLESMFDVWFEGLVDEATVLRLHAPLPIGRP